MPIKSEQQRKFMAMCLHSPEKAKGKCPPKSVANKFIHGHKRKDEMNSYYFRYLTTIVESGMLMTPELINAPLPSKKKRFKLALQKIEQHGEGEEGQPGPTGAVNTIRAALRNKGLGQPTGGTKDGEGNPLRGRK